MESLVGATDDERKRLITRPGSSVKPCDFFRQAPNAWRMPEIRQAAISTEGMSLLANPLWIGSERKKEGKEKRKGKEGRKGEGGEGDE